MDVKSIKITPIDLSKQKIVSINKCELSLYETYAEYEIDFIGLEPIDDEDELLGWGSERPVYQKISFKKHFVTSHNIYYSNKEEKWTLYISVTGMGEDIPIWFSTYDEANEVYVKLEEWIYY